MKKSENEKNGLSMPEYMQNDLVERSTRERVDKLQSGMSNNVKKLRELGVTIDKAEDLKKLTAPFIRKGIAESKAEQLKGQFIPQAIRSQVEREYSQLEAQIVPIANSLQEELKACKWAVHIEGESVYFDGDEVEKYIEETSKVQIPAIIREYYDHLQTICKDWRELSAWCDKNGLFPPSMTLIRKLSKEDRFINTPSAISGHDICSLSITPEEMFNMWLYGIIRVIKSPEPEEGNR